MKNKIVVLGVFIALFSMNCASNKNQKAPSVDMEGIKQAKPIDVGSVEVRLIFIELFDDQVQVEVDEVLGYGASTNRLAPKQTIDVSIHETLIDRISEMESGDAFDAVLAMRPAGINGTSGWTITKILD